MAKFDLKEFARRGAVARIRELNEELEAIYAAFPDLHQSRRGRAAGKVVVNHEDQFSGSRAVAAKPANAAPRRRRRKMTAAQRKAVGERMRKYWAARRNAAGRR